MKKIAITGEIGSGKSTVRKIFANALQTWANGAGVYTVDIDDVVKWVKNNVNEVIAVHSTIFQGMSSNKISEMIFADDNLRKNLENLYAPHVIQYLKEKIAILEEHASDSIVIVEFPLLPLLDENLFDFDHIFICHAPEEIRFKRVQERDSRRSIEEIKNIFAIQKKLFEKANPNFTKIDTSENLVLNVNSAIMNADITFKAETTPLYTNLQKVKRTAIVAGSFDPITNGHLWIVKKALEIADRVHVIVGLNPTKKFLFSEQHRKYLIIKSLAENFNEDEMSKLFVSVLEEDKLLVTRGQELGANFIIRGIRNFTDFEYENQYNLVQKKIAPNLEILYLIPPRELTEISSSLVKGLLNIKGWQDIASGYVSKSVLKALSNKGVE